MTTLLHTGFHTATVGADWSASDTAGRLVVTDPWALERARIVVARELAELGAIVRSRAAVRRTFRDGGWAAQQQRIDPFPYGLAAGVRGGPPHLSLPLPDRRRRRRAPLRLAPGPSLRAWVVQRCAEAVAAETMCGALVAIGGDVATSGLAPAGGWRIDLPATALAMDGGALSRVDVAGRLVVGPAGRPVDPPHWRTVTVVAANGPAASAGCAGALARGASAPDWLAELGLAAHLTDTAGGVLGVGG